MNVNKSLSKNKETPKIKDLTAGQRKLALIRQKQCDAIALHIVKKLIDYPVEEDVFLQSLKYVNQCHYQDVVEERALSKLCGYPVCGKTIPDMPKKMFHISTKQNKVYDITERKNYCSNFCYKAGIYIKEQMLTSPLWFRDKEVIPNFHLLPKTDLGIPGQEIDQGIAQMDFNEENSFTSITTFVQETINDIPDEVCDKVKLNTEHTKDSTQNDVKSRIDDYNLKTENSFLYYKLNTPSLVDILKENADYFKNETVNNTTSESNDATSLGSNSIKSKEILLNTSEVQLNNAKLLENNCVKSKEILLKAREVQLNNAITSENNNFKPKGILSKPRKSEDKGTSKKRVSFISEHLKENEEDVNVNKKSENNCKNKVHHINLLGAVQEKCNIYKSEINQKYNSNEPEKLKLGDAEVKQKINDEKKSRLKNSSAYQKANSMSKPKVFKQMNNEDNFIKIRLKKCVQEWVTFDTIVFLFGEDYVKKLVGESIFEQYANQKKNIERDFVKKKQYNEILNRINLMELADKKFDQSVTGKERRAVPRYEELQDQAKIMDLKVKAFYSNYFENEDDEDADSESENESVKNENESEQCVGKGVPAVLPLVESIDIGPTRKKIFLTSLRRSIPIVCEVLKQSPNVLFSEIKKLVDTFKFEANNIVFRTAELQMVAVVLIKMLSIRDEDLKRELDCEESQVYMTLLEKEFQNGNQDMSVDVLNVLESCIKNLVNVL